MLKCCAHSCFVFAKEEKRLHQAASRVLVVQCRITKNQLNFLTSFVGVALIQIIVMFTIGISWFTLYICPRW